jgi:GntR family transcriptional regulator/MocR family aminotransferase
VSPLFATREAPSRPRPAGLILGYASLTGEQIEQGVRTLGSVIAAPGSTRGVG